MTRTNWKAVTLCAGGILLTSSAVAQLVTQTSAVSSDRLGTERISAQVSSAGGRLGPVTLRNATTGRLIVFPEAFVLRTQDGAVVPASAFPMETPLLKEGFGGGERICTDLASDALRGTLRWCLLGREHAGYVRQQLTIRAGKADLPIAEVRLLDFNDVDALVSGTVQGSPVVDGSMYFGVEHPLSWSKVEGGHVSAGITRQLPLRAGQSITYSSVAGVAAPGQIRREFLSYLEAERPRPYQPFLHYNSWFDLGFGNRYDEAGALDRIHAFGRELVEKRHVQLDSFLFDDGWDDTNSLWRFNAGFPHGLTAVAEAAKDIHSGIGVWMSPWGGYSTEKKERIAYGRAHGLEIVKDGYALSGPKYYDAFEKTCLEMVDRFGVNQFKFDGTGNADRVFPGSAFDSDFDAAIHLIERIRKEKSGVFINLTTGTHPSPFWVFYADSIWRDGDDSGFDGEGPWRQRWITYRDEQTYRNIVQKAPLYPLNSLMLHGIIYAQKAEHLKDDPGGSFADEVVSYFGSGTQLQELYVTPALLTPANWDLLAKAARWSRERASILKDVHWLGGDPGKLEVYGWAAWSPEGWVVTLRNPSSRAQSFSLDLQSALELPPGTPRSYSAHDVFGGGAPQAISAQAAASIDLKPFEVRMIEWMR